MAGLSALQLASKLQQGYTSLKPWFNPAGRPNTPQWAKANGLPVVSQATPKFQGKKRKASFRGSKRSLWSKRRKTGNGSLWYQPHLPVSSAEPVSTYRISTVPTLLGG